MTDFFDLPSDTFVQKRSERRTDTNIYNPDPNSFNGSYKSVFRFVPYIHDKTLSKYTKYSAKFYNPLTKESLFVDCPSNVGKPSILWDLERTIRSIKDEEPELYNQLDRSFSRWYSHFSPVYVKKDPQRPELEGSVKMFKFSAQINNLIESQINPEENELIETAQGVNPYHLLKGKDFVCIVGKKTKIFRDWGKCKFMEEVTPLVFKVGDKQVIVENNEKSINLVQEFLKKNTPVLDEYKHREWTDDTYNKVAEFMISTISNKTILNMVIDRSKDEKIKTLLRAKLSGKPVTNSTPKVEDDLVFSGTNNEPFAKEKVETAAAPDAAPVAAAKSDSTTGNDDYDDLFSDL